MEDPGGFGLTNDAFKPYSNGYAKEEIEFDPYEKDSKHSKYWRSLQTLKPFRYTKRKVPSPVDNAGMFSFVTFSWLSSIMYNKAPLEIKDLPILSKYESCKSNSKRFKRLYEEDKTQHRGKGSISRTFFKFIKTRLIVAIIVVHIYAACAILGPSLLVNRLLTFAEFPNQGIGYGIALAFGLGITELCKSVAFAALWAISYRTCIRARSAIVALLFQKLARLKSLKDKTVGELVNLLGNDAERITEALLIGGMLMASPFLLLVVAIYCIVLIGWSAIIGILVFVFFIPMQFLTGKIMAKYRNRTVVVTDKRVRMMSEILNCVKLIKQYAWESSFAKTIDEIRSEERKLLAKVGFIQSFMVAVIPVVPTSAVVITFLVHTLLRYPLSTPQAFSVFTVFNILRTTIAITPRAVRGIAELLISFRRMDSLMEMEETETYYVTPKSDDIAIHFDHVTACWNAENAAANDNSKNAKIDQVELNHEEPTIEVLNGINLTVNKQRLIGICGSVGSGKSSFMSAILGQMRITKGSLGLSGSIAYVPQQAWIFHDTARENILFGSPWNEEKYNEVVRICSLESDFEILPDKDQTEIGERGINLSGGQKQRVSLARAVYSDRDIVLLDDPLSAVDAHVGKHIFYECIKKALADKTVIFVTHQLQYLKDCDDVILLKDGRISEYGSHDELMKAESEYAQLINKYNVEQAKKNRSDEVDENLLKKVIRQRSHNEGHETNSETELENEIKKRLQCASLPDNNRNSTSSLSSSPNSPLLQTIEPNHSASEDKSENDHTNTDEKLMRKDPIVLIKSEDRQTGTVSGSTYRAYFKAAGGYFASAFVVGQFVLVTLGTSASSWWLTIWLNAGGALIPCNETVANGSTTSVPSNFTATAVTVLANLSTCDPLRDTNISTNPRLGFFQGFYFLIFLLTIIVALIKAWSFSRATLASSTRLHNQVFRSVLTCPMSFFDTTPTGRILNRFSRDLDEVDNRLPLLMDSFGMQIFAVTNAFISVIIVFPYFIVPCLLLAFVFVMLYKMFRRVIRQLKRLDHTARSPWFSHVGSTVQGLSTIHAYNKTDEVIRKFEQLMDTHSQPYYIYHCTSRWLAIRLDALVMILITLTANFVVFAAVYPEYLGETTAPFAGVALLYAITMTGLFQVMIRFGLETESLFTSVERINDYIINTPSEDNFEKSDRTMSDQWPTNGKIEFKDVSMRYRDELPLVLKKVNFKVKSKEKIGIVGRTGSGKSSLGTVLFRLVNLDSGQIFIDDVDTDSLYLHDLRKSISIIPQDPVLFVGTIRYNLDPFQQYSDEDLWKALERTHMKDTISDLPEKLEAEVVENGENFSVGERQLLCMARAILRHSRIIMLDEATAAIDSETDHLVQDTIREAFSDCTMLTIAHRLNTVLTCDKILVMHDGQVAEFDDTVALLENPNSHFSKMVTAATNIQHHQHQETK